MEVIGAIVTVMGCLNKVVTLIEKSDERGGALSIGLSFIKDDLFALKDLSKQLKPGMQLRLQELVFDVDDFIQNLWVPGPVGSFVLAMIGADNRPGYIQCVEAFKQRIKRLKDDILRNNGPAPSGETSTPAGRSPIPYTQEVNLVGIGRPKEEIVELLSPRAGPHRGRIGVISIVGCSGSGKTALARAIYEDKAVAKDFDYKAWVVASDPSSADILNKILQEVVPASAPKSISNALQQFANKILRVLRLLASARWSSTSGALQNFLNKILHPAPARWNISQALEHFPKDKRYLVFVDDVQQGTPCEDIKNAFHENLKDSRIIVTTSVPSVAWDCSSGSNVYTMQALDRENSRELFHRKFREKAGYSAADTHCLRHNDVDIIIDICGGLPIALISAAECLRGKGPNPTRTDFINVGQELRNNLACSESEFEAYKRQHGNETTFVKMRTALVEPYENLLDSGYQESLLYVSMFPSGQRINSKSLVRRLIAEGLAPGDRHIQKDPELVVADVCECLRLLTDRLMIEPVPIRNYYNAAKSCRVRSIMLEFTTKKAVSRNFMSLIRNNQPLYNNTGKVRRLTVQSSFTIQSSQDVGNIGLGLSFLRSLAIFKSGIKKLKECRLVRVLDIEGCPVLTKEIRDNICVLLFLKYLSLRDTKISELPQELEKLKCLETLDSRETGVTTILPVEVIMLPQLAYLFGKFELKNIDKNKKKLDKFFKGKKSQLHTLGGICLDETEVIPTCHKDKVVLLVIQHATKLKKVKVWCKGTLNSGTTELTASDDLETAIRDRSMDLESLSIDFNGVHNTFLGFLETISTSTIGSIKLRKGLGDLPVRELKRARNLSKLHLTSTGCTSKQLADLQYLECLQYLKLAEDADGLWESDFHVKVGGFKRLIWLCFEAPKLPPIKIDDGAMSLLSSLQVLCPEVREFWGIISQLANLNEVILHPCATDDEVKAWKEEAKRHINRPYVEKQQV